MSAARALTESAAACLSIDLASYAAWIDHAAPGQQLIYARGPGLDHKRDVVCRVRDDIAGGRVTAYRKRRPGGEFDFVAVRCREAQAAPKASPFRPLSDAGRLLTLLSETAARGAPCPTNQALADVLGLGGPGSACAYSRRHERARYLLGQLVQAGLITIENRGARMTRVVTIIATGARTSAAALPVGKGFQRVLDGQLPGVDS